MRATVKGYEEGQGQGICGLLRDLQIPRAPTAPHGDGPARWSAASQTHGESDRLGSKEKNVQKLISGNVHMWLVAALVQLQSLVQ